MTTVSSWHAAIHQFTAELRNVYGPRLHSVILYGSRARGEAAEDSDIDLLVVLESCPAFWQEFDRISPIASRISFDHDVVISAIPVGSDEFNRAPSPLLQNVRREGVQVA